ncbi:TetR/AcrR family transcriptional regulator [Nocardia nova]|uniref:TetR/AcrR family transcriptional regulator n=1 Tax=Nocardia nova TaxID=37330 RepID=A0A2S6AUC9_9NOCA|nr:TetR/AcrR family transcriptional regulator [Nocardia nova]PPJ30853.1 TetR/AcrR family transcriptional regulator [Nocardia nova]PPJ38793.1 TetR/AcrR family transcriptional regulator [Nocardia nova]
MRTGQDSAGNDSRIWGGTTLTERREARRTALLEAALDRQVADDFREPMTSFAAAADRDRELATVLVDKVLADPRTSRLLLVEPYSSTRLGQTTIAVMPTFTRLIQDHLFTDIDDPMRRRMAAVTMASGNAGLFAAWLNGSLRADRDQVVDHLVAVIGAYRSMYRD